MLAQLFPKNRYPLRARTRIYLPERNLTVYEERYYRNPITHISQQISGVHLKAFEGKTLVLSYACSLSPNLWKKSYLCGENGVLVPVPNAQLHKLQEEVWGVENFCKIVHLLADTRWEQF